MIFLILLNMLFSNESTEKIKLMRSILVGGWGKLSYKNCGVLNHLIVDKD